MRIDVDVVYDGVGDVLYVSICGDRPPAAATIESPAGFLRRFCSKTGRVTGCTVLDFRHYWRCDRGEQLMGLMSDFLGEAFPEVKTRVDRICDRLGIL